MKILFVCGAPRVFGRETVTLSLMKGLRDRGHEITCVTSTWSSGAFERNVEGLSIPFVRLPLGFISKRVSVSSICMTLAQARKLPSLWFGYKRIMDSMKPDLVVHSAFHHVFLLAPLMGTSKDVYHIHTGFAPTSFYRTLFKVLSRRIDAFVGVSRFVATKITELGVPAAKVHFVLNGVETETDSIGSSNGQGAKQEAEQRTPSFPPLIGIVGQVEEWKGHEDLIEALRILDDRGQPFICRIYGDGSKEFAKRLRSRIANYGLTDKVKWMGFVEDQKMIYDDMDVCVVPTRGPEPFGMVAAEALMHGVPVVASRAGGLPEVILNDKCGCFVDVRSPEQIADRIRDLTRSGSKKSESGGIENSRVLDVLSAKRMVDEMETLFEKLRAGKPVC
jgi:glycosyltransferase involved in cell wall biosynthesis